MSCRQKIAATAPSGTFTVDGMIGRSVAGVPSAGGTFSLNTGFWGGGGLAVPLLDAPFDFDGDGKTDVAIFRPGPAEWWINIRY